MLYKIADVVVHRDRSELTRGVITDNVRWNAWSFIRENTSGFWTQLEKKGSSGNRGFQVGRFCGSSWAFDRRNNGRRYKKALCEYATSKWVSELIGCWSHTYISQIHGCSHLSSDDFCKFQKLNSETTTRTLTLTIGVSLLTLPMFWMSISSCVVCTGLLVFCSFVLIVHRARRKWEDILRKSWTPARYRFNRAAYNEDLNTRNLAFAKAWVSSHTLYWEILEHETRFKATLKKGR